jgi:hypothetical protein
VRPAPDNYFVRFDTVGTDTGARDFGPPQERPRRRRHRRHKRGSARTILLVLLLLAVGAWGVWANGRPGGVSGTINGWIDNVRGDVQDVGTGQDMHNAVKYFQGQYKQTGSYPTASEDQLSAAGISIDLLVVNCSANVVVLQTLTVSHLLAAGDDHGEVAGKQGCPADPNNPAPWH